MCEHVFEPSVAILNRKLKSKPEDDEIVQDDEEDVVDDRIVDVDDAVVDDDIIDDDDASVIEDDILLDENLDSDEDFGEEIIGEKHASIDEDIEETEK
jgi:hypothetical protein